MKLLRRLIPTLKFAWYLWHDIKYDGLGNRIGLWEALTWAADFGWWGF